MATKLESCPSYIAGSRIEPKLAADARSPYREAKELHLERLKKKCSRCGARILEFWRGFGEGAGLKNPVTEPKRSQKSKRPLFHFPPPHGYSFSENALIFASIYRK